MEKPDCRVLPPCPWLPELEGTCDFMVTRRHGKERGAAFRRDALVYAQSQWMSGKPAQAILQLNKAWMAEEAEEEAGVAPYRALVWICEAAAVGGCGFLGNPVRHFQHLASRMSGPRAEVRCWRAWVCFHLAEWTLPVGRFPRDGEQLAREGLWVPGVARAVREVACRGWVGEAEEIRSVMSEAGRTVS